VTDGQTQHDSILCIASRGKNRHFYVPRPSLPHDAMHKRGLCCHTVSVRLSRSWITSKRINISSKFFSPSGSEAILVFPYQTGWRYSDGNPPLTGASNARGYEKIDDFRPISRCISETVIGRWAHAARQFVSIKFSFHPYNIYHDCPRGVPRETKMW